MPADIIEEIIIETKRLILKGITPAIIHHLFNNKSEEEIKVFFGLDESGFNHFKDMHDKGMETNRISLYFFSLVEKESGLPVGECGLHTWNRTHQRAELFYLLRNDANKSRGLMKEALPEVIKFGFQQLDINRIQAMVAKNNVPSIKLLLKNGFIFEGTMREDYVVDGIPDDSDCYSLLKKEWLQNNAS